MRTYATKVIIDDWDSMLVKIGKKAKWQDYLYANEWGRDDDLPSWCDNKEYLYLYYDGGYLTFDDESPENHGAPLEVDNDKFIKLVTLDYCFSLLEEIL